MQYDDTKNSDIVWWAYTNNVTRFFREPHQSHLSVIYRGQNGHHPRFRSNAPQSHKLAFDSCQLTSLPDYWKPSNLKELILGYNRLTTLPESIKNLRNLTTLILSDNPISESERVHIQALLPNCDVCFWRPCSYSKFFSMYPMRRGQYTRFCAAEGWWVVCFENINRDSMSILFRIIPVSLNLHIDSFGYREPVNCIQYPETSCSIWCGFKLQMSRTRVPAFWRMTRFWMCPRVCLWRNFEDTRKRLLTGLIGYFLK